MLGQAGFTIITIAALISTFSAINASIYGGGQVNYGVARNRELPRYFTDMWLGQPVGVGLTALLTLIVVNTLHLENISTAGSIGFLLIFAIVNLAAFRLRKQARTTSLIILTGCLLCFVACGVLVAQQWNQNRVGVLVAGAIIAVCFAAEFAFQKTQPPVGYTSDTCKRN